MIDSDAFRLVSDLVDVPNCDLQEACLDSLMFTEVKFLRDFGPWSKDQVCHCIEFDFDHGRIKEWDEYGDFVRGVTIGLTYVSDMKPPPAKVTPYVPR
jgi:hypothetical protein